MAVACLLGVGCRCGPAAAGDDGALGSRMRPALDDGCDDAWRAAFREAERDLGCPRSRLSGGAQLNGCTRLLFSACGQAARYRCTHPGHFPRMPREPICVRLPEGRGR